MAWLTGERRRDYTLSGLLTEGAAVHLPRFPMVRHRVR